jgi:anti-sigma B factor antagonist/stage II sporulation protein AA (anti-sigma F factor antagonist)
MDLSTTQLANVTIAVPLGRIDQSTSASFEQALAPLIASAGVDKTSIVLDFSAVEYISSAGLRVLMIASKQMTAHRARFVLAAPQTLVAEILKVSRFDRVLEVAPSVRIALGWLSQAAAGAHDKLNATGTKP